MLKHCEKSTNTFKWSLWFCWKFNTFCCRLELDVILVPILWDQICICAIKATFSISGWQVFSAPLLRGSQFSNTAPLGSKPITYLPRTLFFSAFDISHQRRGKAEKLLKRQCLEFGIFIQACLGQSSGIICLYSKCHFWAFISLQCNALVWHDSPGHQPIIGLKNFWVALKDVFWDWRTSKGSLRLPKWMIFWRISFW